VRSEKVFIEGAGGPRCYQPGLTVLKSKREFLELACNKYQTNRPVLSPGAAPRSFHGHAPLVAAYGRSRAPSRSRFNARWRDPRSREA
jgi:hypothetical protein